MTDPNETSDSDRPDDQPPVDVPSRPKARERGRMRRRLREQRRLREALLMDLGALVFELHRHGRREPQLLQAKAAELSAVDSEVRALSEALDQDVGVVELVTAGIAGSCSNCGMLLSTSASFCANCGAPAKAGLEAAQVTQPERALEGETVVDEPVDDAELEPEPEPDPPIEVEESEVEEEPEPEPEPEGEPEPEPELQPEPEPAGEQPSAPWLRGDSAAGSPPEPIRVQRQMGRVERMLRGKRKR